MFIYTLIANIGIVGLYAVDNAYIAEFLPPRNRGKWQSAMGTTVIPGFAASTLLMLVVPSVPTLGGLPFGWRIIPLIGFFPALLLFFVRRTLPESVRFLLSRGRVEEAAKIVEKLEASAGPNYHYEGPPVAPTLAHIGKANPKLFFKKPYIFYTISFWLGFVTLMYVSSTAYFLPTIFMMGLGGGMTGLLATVTIQQCINGSRLLSRVFAIITIDRIGRKAILILGSAMTTIGMATWAYPWAHRAEVPFLFLIVPAILSMWADCWRTGFLISNSELYPIEARSMAYGFAMGIGTIASISSPLLMVGLLADIQIFFYFVAALSLISLVITVKWIPETARRIIEVSSKDSVFK
jgi:putative MFS transporter